MVFIHAVLLSAGTVTSYRVTTEPRPLTPLFKGSRNHFSNSQGSLVILQWGVFFWLVSLGAGSYRIWNFARFEWDSLPVAIRRIMCAG